MREILFRGQAIKSRFPTRLGLKDGEWIYGLFTKEYDDNFPTLAAEMKCLETGVNGISVKFDTIGQFTGLTDKNGTKIFEGDILRDFNGAWILQVIWVSYCCKFGVKVLSPHKLQVDNSLRDKSLYGFRTNTYEIIGNIHDNPELVKGDSEEK